MATYRKLVETRPDTLLPDFADARSVQSGLAASLGRHEEALAASSEAAAICREHAKVRADTFLPHLAHALNNLAASFYKLRRYQEALEAINEAVAIWRELNDSLPEAFIPHLARALSNLGIFSAALGQETLAAISEAIGLYRELAGAEPEAFLPELAGSLGAQAEILSQQQLHAEAARSVEEGIEVVADQFRALPRAFAGVMRSLVNGYSGACRAAGIEPDEVLLAPVVDILQRLARDEGAAGKE